MKLNLKITKHPPQQFVTIAHGGGHIGDDAPGHSAAALERAIQLGYDMVELDVVGTTDDEPVLVHGAWYGPRREGERPEVLVSFHDKTLAEARRQRHPCTGQAVLTLAEGLAICRGYLGVMLDFKQRDRSPAFYERVAAAMDEFGLAGATLTLGDRSAAYAPHLAGRAIFVIGLADLDHLGSPGCRREAHYGFEIPTPLADEPLLAGAKPFRPGLAEADVRKFHEAGVGVIVAINDFLYDIYPDGRRRHVELARRDIERYKAAGVDGFQFDAAYYDLVFSGPNCDGRSR